MNVKSLITVNYENWTLGHIRQTNPIQSQNKPNLVRRFWTPKMNVSYCLTMNYEQSAMNCLTKTNPNKAKTNPIYGEQSRTTCRVVALCEDGSKPISGRMNVNFYAIGYHESKTTFAVRKAGPIFEYGVQDD